MTNGKIIALTILTYVGKVMSLLFNMLSEFAHGFSTEEQISLFSELQSLVILQPKKIKSVTVCNFSPSICYEEMGLDARILVFFFFLSCILNQVF